MKQTKSHLQLDYVLALKPEDFLERRLQTQVGSELVLQKLNNLLSFSGLQARPGQVHSSRSSSHPSETHPSEETGGQHPIIRRQTRVSEAH